MILALGAYYFTPFVRWDRGPGAPRPGGAGRFRQRPLLLLLHRAVAAGGVLHHRPADPGLAPSVSGDRAVFGRVWCGYACPQTVWTDLFIAVERLFEGDRNKRMKLDKQPWSLDKAWRKGGKHAVWLLIAGATGGAWILYFHDAFEVVNNFVTGQAALTSYIFFGVLTFTTYTLAGTMREQVCTYMCPWPRIQGALTDKDALNVTYRT
jgi:polyferredoxin